MANQTDLKTIFIQTFQFLSIHLTLNEQQLVLVEGFVSHQEVVRDIPMIPPYYHIQPIRLGKVFYLVVLKHVSKISGIVFKQVVDMYFKNSMFISSLIALPKDKKNKQKWELLYFVRK